MTNKKGFTLIEITVVLIILGVLAAIAVPNYMTSLQQGEARNAKNNLISIYGAQRNYYFTNGSYCLASCNSLANINTALSLNLTDTYFNTYTCSNTTLPYQCTATASSGTVVLDASQKLSSTNPSCTGTCPY